MKSEVQHQFSPDYLQQNTCVDRIVLGTAGLGGVWGEVNADESIDTILCALEKGVKALDTAPAYSNAEEYVGKALKQWQGNKPIISTKAGRLKGAGVHAAGYDYSRDALKKSVESSLRILDVSKIDILFLHDPFYLSREEAPHAIETLLYFKEQGIIDKIGIGGNYPNWFRDLIMPGVFSVCMGYNRLNLINVAALNEEIPFLYERGIGYYAASPLNMGLLGNRLKEHQHNKPEWISEETLLKALQLNDIARENGFNLSDLALKFIKAIPAVNKVVIGPSDKEQFEQCFNYWTNGFIAEELFQKILQYNTSIQKNGSNN